MIFDDIGIRNIVCDDELYVSVFDLKEHLSKATQEFSDETKGISLLVNMTREEKIFIAGLINGMFNVVIMLNQSNDENELNKIQTIDELLDKFDQIDKME